MLGFLLTLALISLIRNIPDDGLNHSGIGGGGVSHMTCLAPKPYTTYAAFPDNAPAIARDIRSCQNDVESPKHKEARATPKSPEITTGLRPIRSAEGSDREEVAPNAVIPDRHPQW